MKAIVAEGDRVDAVEMVAGRPTLSGALSGPASATLWWGSWLAPGRWCQWGAGV